MTTHTQPRTMPFDVVYANASIGFRPTESAKKQTTVGRCTFCHTPTYYLSTLVLGHKDPEFATQVEMSCCCRAHEEIIIELATGPPEPDQYVLDLVQEIKAYEVITKMPDGTHQLIKPFADWEPFAKAEEPLPF